MEVRSMNREDKGALLKYKIDIINTVISITPAANSDICICFGECFFS